MLAKARCILVILRGYHVCIGLFFVLELLQRRDKCGKRHTAA